MADAYDETNFIEGGALQETRKQEDTVMTIGLKCDQSAGLLENDEATAWLWINQDKVNVGKAVSGVPSKPCHLNDPS